MNKTYENDIINKQYCACGCIILSTLDIYENIINELNIQYCKKHYHNTKFNNDLKYFYNCKIKKYLLISDNYKKNNNIILHNQHIIKTTKLTLMEFGKYYNKTYDYVYNNDKMYCYKLAFWNNHIIKNNKIIKFIEFIKQQLLSE